MKSIPDATLELIIRDESLIFILLSVATSVLCTMWTAAMYKRNGRRSVFHALLLLESSLSLASDLFALVLEFSLRGLVTIDAASYCARDQLIYTLLHHATLIMHIMLSVLRAGLFRFLYIAPRAAGDVRSPLEWTLPPKSPVPTPLVRPGTVAIDDPRIAYRTPYLYRRFRALLTLRWMHTTGYRLELVRRALMVIIPLVYITTEVESVSNGCRADKPQPIGEETRFWVNVYRAWVLIFALFQVIISLYTLLGTSVVVRQHRFRSLKRAVFIMEQLGSATSYVRLSFAVLLLFSIIVWNLPVFLGIAVHAFLCRIYLAWQLAYFQAMATVFPHIPSLRMSLGSTITAEPAPISTSNSECVSFNDLSGGGGGGGGGGSVRMLNASSTAGGGGLSSSARGTIGSATALVTPASPTHGNRRISFLPPTALSTGADLELPGTTMASGVHATATTTSTTAADPAPFMPPPLPSSTSTSASTSADRPVPAASSGGGGGMGSTAEMKRTNTSMTRVVLSAAGDDPTGGGGGKAAGGILLQVPGGATKKVVSTGPSGSSLQLFQDAAATTSGTASSATGAVGASTAGIYSHTTLHGAETPSLVNVFVAPPSPASQRHGSDGSGSGRTASDPGPIEAGPETGLLPPKTDGVVLGSTSSSFGKPALFIDASSDPPSVISLDKARESPLESPTATVLAPKTTAAGGVDDGGGGKDASTSESAVGDPRPLPLRHVATAGRTGSTPYSSRRRLEGVSGGGGAGEAGEAGELDSLNQIYVTARDGVAPPPPPPPHHTAAATAAPPMRNASLG
ncbi:Hsp70 chaperone [Blastocladiella emersonii ATCC 22665]|nr:Hsp70 chaperone [Blastocladiella emersonii ATCC 22665]